MLQNSVSIESNMRAMHEQSYAAVPEHRHGFMRAPPSREGRMLQNSVSAACVGFSDFHRTRNFAPPRFANTGGSFHKRRVIKL